MFSEIGSKIKKLRAERNLTLKELNQMTNLSIGFLSQLERGLTTVAIDTLEVISKALGVDMNYFFTASKDQPGIVQKSYEREVVLLDRNNYVQFYLSHNLSDKSMLPRLIEIYPKRENEQVLSYTHEGEEFIYVLEGILTYYYNGERYELYPNDSVHIISTSSHNWENNTNKIVRLLMVSIPNRFEKKEDTPPV